MTPLRQRMTDDMTVRGLAENTKKSGIVRLNLFGRLSLFPFVDFRAQKHVLSGLDQTSAGDEAGSTTGKS